MRLSQVKAENKNNSQMNFGGVQGTATKAVKEPFKMPFNKTYSWMSSANGVHQRLVLGVASIATQPFIDYYNPKADEKTRKYSVLKTVVKIVVGTTVGCLVRKGAIELTNSLVKDSKKFTSGIKNPEAKKNIEKWLAFKKDASGKVLKDEKGKDIPTDKRKQFVGNLGTIFGIIGVVAADLAIDMPVAKFLIEKSAKKFKLEEPPEGGAHG